MGDVRSSHAQVAAPQPIEKGSPRHDRDSPLDLAGLALEAHDERAPNAVLFAKSAEPTQIALVDPVASPGLDGNIEAAERRSGISYRRPASLRGRAVVGRVMPGSRPEACATANAPGHKRITVSRERR